MSAQCSTFVAEQGQELQSCRKADVVAYYRCDECFTLRTEERAPCWNCGTDEIMATEAYCSEHAPKALD